ncbi:hypothetical protein ACQEVZ_20155 [Dactylosporangium sp. CA-152071]
MTLVLIELAASIVLVAVIHAVQRHACDPRRDAGRHAYVARHTLAGAR